LRLYALHHSKFNDPRTPVSYIGPVMLDQGQMLYIEEVLGVPAHMFSFESSEESVPAIGVFVMTPELTPEQETLLSKILASVKLSEYTHAEVNEVRLGELPEGISAQHVLAFNDEHNGRSTSHSAVWWSLPSLSTMTGEGSEVAALKKEAWTILQQFAQENRA
jgi:hypothetical protein